jgi:polyhydroxybutyrate depolymerase
MRLRAVGFFWSIAACTSSPGATLGESSGSTSAGAGTSGPTSSSSGGEAATSGSSETTGEPASPGCGAPGAAGKQAGLPLEHDGLARRFDLYVPPGYDPEVAAPLVLNFHGNLSTPAEQAAFSGFEASAGPRGMLVAYPEGLGNSFNGGVCCGDAAAQDVDDVGFARAIVAEVSRTHCVDPRRVFVTGMSNGGHMAHRLACEAADVFAAAASVTGVLQLAPADCAPVRPISMLDFHGTGDVIVPYDGKGTGYPPVPEMMAGWAARDGCDADSVEVFAEGDTRCETWPGCADEVEVTLCTIAEGGHCWPGDGVCPFGHNSSVRDASEAIAALFAAHPLP